MTPQKQVQAANRQIALCICRMYHVDLKLCSSICRRTPQRDAPSSKWFVPEEHVVVPLREIERQAQAEQLRAQVSAKCLQNAFQDTTRPDTASCLPGVQLSTGE